MHYGLQIESTNTFMTETKTSLSFLYAKFASDITSLIDPAIGLVLKKSKYITW